MSVDNLLSRLDRVRKRGTGRWMAVCPAHEDKSPSLAVSEGKDGRTLIHCFAGCEVQHVLGAIGMSFDDLFPERLTVDHARPIKRPWRVGDLVRALEFELAVAFIALRDVASERPLAEVDRKRVAECADRIAHFLSELRHAA